VTTTPRDALKPVLLEIPDHWTPETDLAVSELINDLRDQIWARYATAIQNELRRQLLPGDSDENDAAQPQDF
jgi:hypothetical protein